MTKQYVVGFMFSLNQQRVALVKKNRPKWLAGLLNGIGGHVEDSDDSLLSARIREFSEETGHMTAGWEKYARISEDGNFDVTFFYATGELSKVQTKTDEEIIVVDVANIASLETIENLPWLIPLALDCMNDGRPKWTEVNYPKRHKDCKGGK